MKTIYMFGVSEEIADVIKITDMTADNLEDFYEKFFDDLTEMTAELVNEDPECFDADLDLELSGAAEAIRSGELTVAERTYNEILALAEERFQDWDCDEEE